MSFDFFSLFRLAQPVYSVRFLLKLITLLSVLTKILSFFSFYLECVKFSNSIFLHMLPHTTNHRICIFASLLLLLKSQRQTNNAVVVVVMFFFTFVETVNVSCLSAIHVQICVRVNLQQHLTGTHLVIILQAYNNSCMNRREAKKNRTIKRFRKGKTKNRS